MAQKGREVPHRADCLGQFALLQVGAGGAETTRIIF
jgi:hypothetical protein